MKLEIPHERAHIAAVKLLAGIVAVFVVAAMKTDYAPLGVLFVFAAVNVEIVMLAEIRWLLHRRNVRDCLLKLSDIGEKINDDNISKALNELLAMAAPLVTGEEK